MGKEFALGATEQGVVAASSLFGILIGASAFGGLADRYGRKQIFIIEMVLFCIFTAVLALSPSYAVAVAALLGVGVALGCDYPTAHLIISESVPSRSWPDGAGGVRVSGGGRLGGHGRRLPDPVRKPRYRRLALDIRQHARARG